MIGVYQDLVAMPGGFGAAFTVGPPLALDGKTDVHFARLGPCAALPFAGCRTPAARQLLSPREPAGGKRDTRRSA